MIFRVSQFHDFSYISSQTLPCGNVPHDWIERLRIRNLRPFFFQLNEFNLLVSQFPQLIKCRKKVRSNLHSGSRSLNEEVPCTANESRCTATRSINVITEVPRGPIQDGVSSLRERCGASLLLPVNSWPFNATSAQFDTVRMCWSFKMANIGRVW